MSHMKSVCRDVDGASASERWRKCLLNEFEWKFELKIVTHEKQNTARLLCNGLFSQTPKQPMQRNMSVNHEQTRQTHTHTQRVKPGWIFTQIIVFFLANAFHYINGELWIKLTD